MAQQQRTVGALMYPGFEMLDMFGPLEMFSMLGPDLVEIQMLAATKEPVSTAVAQALDAGPKVAPDSTFEQCAVPDILLVPGGFGTLPALEDAAILEFLRGCADAEIICSVCTGSLLLARSGLLDSRRATTNKQFFALSAMEIADVDWVEEARWVEDGNVFTSSGVSAGMDMSLAIIERLYGSEAADSAAAGAEYTWHRDAETDPFIEHLNVGAREMGLVS